MGYFSDSCTLKVTAEGAMVSPLDLAHHKPYECLILGYLPSKAAATADGKVIACLGWVASKLLQAWAKSRAEGTSILFWRCMLDCIGLLRFNPQVLFKFLWFICRILGHTYLEMMIFTLTDVDLLCRIVKNNQFYPISLWSSLYQAITPESRH